MDQQATVAVTLAPHRKMRGHYIQLGPTTDEGHLVARRRPRKLATTDCAALYSPKVAQRLLIPLRIVCSPYADSAI